ncbi:PREDICTED: zinc finger BED domain-containing protein RICESLEEPER 2-like [Camelina sativa]|uniref:Zinc finger BED domain-containing protein RICESLEEPER 2-like n=1 Tax=Camelina sativa TaxID=90675 RepID=A0ABM0WGV2_CAMSA|nr:PREDICTED: zinc finger BED domain-containing protein RICESLEEPER 2-like [Camelina sativa]
MSHDSGEENIDPVLREEIDDGPTASPVGGKRRQTQATTSTVPSQPRKKPAHRSPVWEHFIQQAHDQALTNCRYCGQPLGCDTVIHGTSAMKNHISRCKLYKMHLESGTQSVLAGDSSGVMTAIKYDQALFRRKTSTLDIYSMFLREKGSLKELFAHWIDRDWKLQKRIISFKPVTDHKGLHSNKALRVFTDALIMRGPDALVSNGDYLHMRCCAHVLNLIVRDGLSKAKRSIVSIRNAIKYVRSSGDRLKSFLLRVDTGNVGRGSLCLDVATRWNSTYLMLTAANKFRVAFEKMLTEDKLYNDYFMETEENSEENGDEAEFPGQKRVASKSVTSTICYNEIVTIERNLINLSTNGDVLLKTEATMMRSKFEKYWDGLLNMNPLVIIASVFDPRNKMQFAGLCFDKLYGKDSVESTHLRSSIKGVMKKMYAEYVMKLSVSEQVVPTTGGVVVDVGVPASDLYDLSDEDGYERMDTLYSEMVAECTNEECSSELDIYLLEKPVPRTPTALGLDFDVLSCVFGCF